MAVAESLNINGRVYHDPKIDIERARERIWAFPGKAIFVAPDPDSENVQGDFVLADKFAHRRRLPVAKCIAAHPDTGLEVGATYIVNQKYAKRVKNVRIADFHVPKEAGQIWLFGATSPTMGTFRPIPPKLYAYCKLDDGEQTYLQWPECIFPVAEVQAHRKTIGNMVILKLPGRNNFTAGNGADRAPVLRIDRQAERPDIALVESVSPQCHTAKPGMLVWYQRRALTGLFADGADFACLPEDAIFAAVNLT